MKSFQEKALKRNLIIVTFFLIAAVVCSVAISPTQARRGVASLIASDGSRRFDLAANSPTAQLGLAASSGGQETQQVSGTLIQTERQDPELAKAFRDYDLIKLDPRAAAAQIRSSGKLSITTSQGKFDMQLTPHPTMLSRSLLRKEWHTNFQRRWLTLTREAWTDRQAPRPV